MLALETGQIVLVILEISGGSVRKIKLEKATDAPCASCICRVGPSWVFLGSWLGDSCLLHARSAERAKVPFESQLNFSRDLHAKELKRDSTIDLIQPSATS